MSTQTRIETITHLNFRGEARAALAFYQSVFGGDATLVTYRDAGNVQDPADADLVMWGQVAAASGFRVMAYDVQAALPWQPGENAFFVSVRGDTADAVRTLWDKLVDGAQVQHEIAPAPWTPLYGKLKDLFGVTWLLDVSATAS